MPILTKKIKELQEYLDMLDFRIDKQKKLLDKIASGKWKQTQVSEEVLYALTKHDLIILEKEGANAKKRMTELKHQVSNDNFH